MGIIDRLKSRHQTKFITVNPHDCIACCECVTACPKGVLGKIDFLGHRHVKISNGDLCIGCMKCIRTCPRKCFKTRQNQQVL